MEGAGGHWAAGGVGAQREAVSDEKRDRLTSEAGVDERGQKSTHTVCITSATYRVS